jgi:hypothetical protein
VSPAEQRVCEQCGARFVPAKAWAKFCSDACRIRAHRQSKRATEPSAVLQHVLQHAITALRTNENTAAALSAARRELDAFEATTLATKAKWKAAPAPAALAARPAARAAPPPRQASLFDVGPVEVSPVAPAQSVAPVVVASTSDLQARLQAALDAGHGQGAIGKAIGFGDGTTLSHWRAGRKSLSAEKIAALTAYLTEKGL